MKNLKNKKIVIFNDSPIQAKDLKKFLEIENSGNIFTAETYEALEKTLTHNNIDIILAEFTMPKAVKNKIQKFLKKISKDPVNYLVINTRIIISANKADTEDDDLHIFSRKMIDAPVENIVSDNQKYDVSQNIHELYQQELSLNILSNNKSLEAEFLEFQKKGLLIAVKEELKIDQEYCFTIKNFLNETNEYILYGKVKDVNKNTIEKNHGGFLIYLEIRKENEKLWDELLKKIQAKQTEANSFIKKANGR